ncbi:MAG: 3-keto-5-aminohexanoate cleavage protein [Rickettsiales bacterium]|nr:3-keto-5-aminohexanoate cleavage protein [Rickettsiales bacterium]
MNSEVSIIFAPTGSRYFPKNSGKGDFEHPHLIYKPEDLAKEINQLLNEGLISQVHLHARNPEDGFPTGNPEHYKLLLQALQENIEINDYYLSITTTDNNIPKEDKEASGDMARAAILLCNYDNLKPNRIPLIDTLAASLQVINSNRSVVAERFNEFIDNCLKIMEQKNIGFEIEIPNYNLFEVAKDFLAKMRYRINRNEFNSENLIGSINAPVIQMLFGARDNMPCTEEFISNALERANNELSPRSIQVGFRHNHDQFNPDIARFLLGLAKQGKIQGIRIGIEDTPKNMDGEYVSNSWLVEQINKIAKEVGVSIRPPQEALNLIQNKNIVISSAEPSSVINTKFNENFF